MIKGIIFDLDGTLIDSMPVWSTIGKEYLLSKKVTPKEDVDARIKTMSFEQSAQFYQEDYKIDCTAQELLDFCKKTADHQYRNVVGEKPGASDFVRWLRQRDLKLCVATASDEELAVAALERLGMLDAFTFILSCRELQVGKDVPDVYDEACRRLELEKEEVLVFEDALHCHVTLKKAGYRTVGIEDDSAAEEREQIQALSDYYLTDYRQAYQLFARVGERAIMWKRY